ncbi:MAG: copper amine oxidase N-terminal domain-containing protein, partial [Clostridia bacterium]
IFLMKKKLLSAVLACALLLSCLGVYADDTMFTVTQKPITVTYNGGAVSFPDALPLIRNDKTLVPVRAIMERAKLAVDFDAATRTVTAQNEELSIRMGIDDVNAAVTAGGKTQNVTLEEPARIIENRTYVPVRFIAESLGTKVNWNPSAREVVIIDTAEWKREITDKSKLMSKLLEMPLAAKEAQAGSMAGTYRMVCDMKNIPDANGKPVDLHVDLNLTLSGTNVFDGTNTGSYILLETDLTALKDLLKKTGGDAASEALSKYAKPYKIDLDIIVDSDWNLYVKSEGILDILKDAGLGHIADQIGNRYVKLPLKELLSSVLDFSAFEAAMDSAETLWDFIEKFVAADDVLYTQSVAMLDSLMDLYAEMYADELFTVTEQKDGSELWQYELDKDTYINAVMNMTKAMGETMAVPMDDAALAEQKRQLEDMDMSLIMTMTVKDDVPVKAEVTFKLNTKEQPVAGTTDATVKLQYEMNIGASTRAFDEKKDKKVVIPENVIDFKEIEAIIGSADGPTSIIVTPESEPAA